MTKQGIELEDGPVRFLKLTDEGGEGFNHWYRLVLKEGRNRVVRRTFEALGLPVSRLMRVRFGIVNLPPSVKRGKMAELGEGEVGMILDWVGLTPQPAAEAEPELATARSTPGKAPPRAETGPHRGARRAEAGKGRPRQGKAEAPRGRRGNKTKAGVKG